MQLNEEKLMVALAEKGMSIKDLCSQVPISENAFRDIRKKKVHPRAITVGKIAKALGVPVEDLIDMEGGE